MGLDDPLSRRDFLAAGLATTLVVRTALAGAALQQAPATVAPPPIHPRSEWGGDLLPRGEMPEEAPGDVRFLLVHHSETPNDDAPEDIAPRLRSIFDYHTAAKGWPDVAYNFFVDAFGGIWEGRTGSIERPVRGDATGGSQGFALLCCFVGDHSAVPPTEPALRSMAALTAWLASTYAVDLHAGPTITFVSRGSNRWPAGTQVTTDPIAGHRDMSQTACPGDAAYPLVRGTILEQAQGIIDSAAPPTTTTPAPTTSSSAVPPSTGVVPPTTTIPGEAAAAATRDDGHDANALWKLGATATMAIGAVAAVIHLTSWFPHLSTPEARPHLDAAVKPPWTVPSAGAEGAVTASTSASRSVQAATAVFILMSSDRGHRRRLWDQGVESWEPAGPGLRQGPVSAPPSAGPGEWLIATTPSSPCGTLRASDGVRPSSERIWSGDGDLAESDWMSSLRFQDRGRVMQLLFSLDGGGPRSSLCSGAASGATKSGREWSHPDINEIEALLTLVTPTADALERDHVGGDRP